MNDLTIKLIIILVPGALATLIFGKLILHKEWSNFKFVLYSIIFGIISYLTVQLIINIINLFISAEIDELTIWENLNNANAIPYKEVIYASITSILVSFIASLIENKKIVHKLASKLNISYKYGDENLFSMFLGSQEIHYIYLRDIKNELTYHGYVKSFSENENLSEIRLMDVAVYNYADSEFLYWIDQVYLSLNKQDIIIELSNLNTNEQEITTQESNN